MSKDTGIKNEQSDGSVDKACHVANVKSRLEEICDRKCNQCPLINKANSKMLTVIFNKLFDKFGNGVYEIVESHCPNLTVCYDCRIDDFCHIEGCKLVD